MLRSQTKPTDLNELFIEGVEEPSTMAGWVSPRGEYYRVADEWGHSALADRILAEPGDCYARLGHSGWVHLSDKGVFTISAEFKLTRAQENTLFDIATLVPDSDFAERIISALADKD